MPDNALGTNTQIGILEEKLDSLRRQVISITVMGVLVLGVLIWMEVDRRASAGRAVDTIEAHNFVVRDSQGRARAVLQSMGDVGAQLVFFRDPATGDAWRARQGPGPFVFGARDWRGNGQMLLTNSDGTSFDFVAGTASIDRNGRTSVAISATPTGEGRIDLWGASEAHTTLSAAAEEHHQPNGRRR